MRVCVCVFVAMLQADDEDDMMEMQMKSPFGSSFRTFNATDYKPIGQAPAPFQHLNPPAPHPPPLLFICLFLCSAFF